MSYHTEPRAAGFAAMGFVANAVDEAFGVRMFELPMTPVRILRATIGPTRSVRPLPVTPDHGRG